MKEYQMIYCKKCANKTRCEIIEKLSKIDKTATTITQRCKCNKCGYEFEHIVAEEIKPT